MSRGRIVRRPPSVHARLRLVLVLVVMVLSVFGARLVQLQGVDPKAYAARARDAGAASVTLPARRGTIEDRTGAPLANSVSGSMLIADPVVTRRYATVIARILATRLDMDYFATLDQLRKKDTHYQLLERRVPSTLATATVAQIQAAVKDLITDPKVKKIPFIGVYTAADPVRSYPGDDIAANMVGILDEDGVGRYGLEKSFQTWLAGKDGNETYEVGDGKRIPLGDNSETAPVNGKDLHLTIDRDTQWYVQRVLRNAVQSSGGDSGTAVVMRVRTGEILALADYPTFDANRSSDLRTKRQLGNVSSRALAVTYEPGSVEKVLTFGALLDAHKVSPTTRITVPHELPVLDRTIHDYFEHDVLHLTATGVIAKSSNIGTVLSATQMSPARLRGYLTRFGLGSTTDIGLPQNSGTVPVMDASQLSTLTRATVAFGQGISVNTLQMATAVNAVANGGMWVSPSLVEGSATTDGHHEVGTDHTTQHRVISAHAAKRMAQMMESVPDPDTGTAPKAQVPGYLVSGKTGTAQRVGKDCGCYDGTFTTSFAGFVPSDKPAFTVYVVVQNPKNGGGGGSIGGPAFSKIESFLLQKYGVAPTGTKPADLPIEW